MENHSLADMVGIINNSIEQNGELFAQIWLITNSFSTHMDSCVESAEFYNDSMIVINDANGNDLTLNTEEAFDVRFDTKEHEIDLSSGSTTIKIWSDELLFE